MDHFYNGANSQYFSLLGVVFHHVVTGCKSPDLRITVNAIIFTS